MLLSLPFLSNDVLRLWLHSVQYDPEHDFALVADEADCQIALALPIATFLWKCDDQGLGPQGWPFSCLPALVADF